MLGKKLCNRNLSQLVGFCRAVLDVFCSISMACSQILTSAGDAWITTAGAHQVQTPSGTAVCSCRDRQSLSIPVEALPTLPEASITLSVTVANVFNISSASNFTFSKQNSSQAPTFELDKSLTQFHPSQGFRVVANRLPSSCRATAGAGDEVWEWSTDIPGVRLDGVQTTRLVFPPADLVGNVELGKVTLGCTICRRFTPSRTMFT